MIDPLTLFYLVLFGKFWVLPTLCQLLVHYFILIEYLVNLYILFLNAYVFMWEHYLSWCYGRARSFSLNMILGYDYMYLMNFVVYFFFYLIHMHHNESIPTIH